jgi:hypothetical protein
MPCWKGTTVICIVESLFGLIKSNLSRGNDVRISGLYSLEYYDIQGLLCDMPDVKLSIPHRP